MTFHRPLKVALVIQKKMISIKKEKETKADEAESRNRDDELEEIEDEREGNTLESIRRILKRSFFH
jgi:hypothetical protein